VIDPEAVLIDL